MSEKSQVPESQSGSWAAFLKSIASFNGDLSSLTAPPFILSPVSLVEYSLYWLASRDLFFAASNEQDPEKRFLLVVKWFIATLKLQYCSRSDKLGSEKKPLNPVLGELYTASSHGKGVDQYGDVVCVSEQVSHHPPVTAYAMWNDAQKVKVEGYNQIKAGFSTTTGISVKQFGHALYQLEGFNNETYMITLPNLHIEGLMFGAPYVELEGKSFIQSSTGYTAHIDYSGKGYFSGKKNSFKAKVYKHDTPKNVLYSISGQWSGASKIKNPADSSETSFLDTNSQVKVEEWDTKPIEEQTEMESRRLWKKVADAIHKGDYDLIHREKSKIENEQRELRKQEEEKGTEWARHWFKQVTVAEEPIYQTLCKNAGVVAGPSHSSSSTHTSGANAEKDKNWRFVLSKYNEGDVKPPTQS